MMRRDSVLGPLLYAAALFHVILDMDPLHAQPAGSGPGGGREGRGAQPRESVAAAAYVVPAPTPAGNSSSVLLTYRIPYGMLAFRPKPDASGHTADLDVAVSLYGLTSAETPRKRDLDRMQAVVVRTQNLYLDVKDLDEAVTTKRSHQGAVTIAMDDSWKAEDHRFLLPIVEILNPGREPRRLELPVIDTRSPVQFIPLQARGVRADSLQPREEVRMLMNLGGSVRYAEDFGLMMVIRRDSLHADVFDGGRLRLEVGPAKGGSAQTEAAQADSMRDVVTADLGAQGLAGAAWTLHPFVAGLEIATAASEESGGAIGVGIRSDSAGGSDWLVLVAEISGRRFPNSRLTATLSGLPATAEEDEGSSGAGISGRVIGKTDMGSLWPDIPRALLSLDKALDDMGLLLGEEEVKRLGKAGRERKIERFQSYWTPRDPTPGTHYNELMVEYFRRVDTAMDRYTTPTTRGSSSDQGKAYIIHGEPIRIDREFPTGSPALERWTYRDFVLVFEATTGFGDFRLKEKNDL